MARFNSTTNYGWPNPDSTDKINTAGFWGTDLESCINSIDSKLYEVDSRTADFTKVTTQQSTDQTIGSASWTRVVNWASATVDDNGEFSLNRFTADNTGRYLFEGNTSVQFTATAAGGRQQISPYVNSVANFTRISQSMILADNTNFLDFSFILDLTAGDYVDLYYYQNSGGNVLTDADFFLQTVTRLL